MWLIVIFSNDYGNSAIQIIIFEILTFISMWFCFFSGAAMLGIVVVLKVIGFAYSAMMVMWWFSIPVGGYLVLPIVYRAAVR